MSSVRKSAEPDHQFIKEETRNENSFIVIIKHWKIRESPEWGPSQPSRMRKNPTLERWVVRVVGYDARN
jgi:hypothetical protein